MTIKIMQKYEYHGLVAMDLNYYGHSITVEVDPIIYHDEINGVFLYDSDVTMQKYPFSILRFKSLDQVLNDISCRLKLVDPYKRPEFITNNYDRTKFITLNEIDDMAKLTKINKNNMFSFFKDLKLVINYNHLILNSIKSDVVDIITTHKLYDDDELYDKVLNICDLLSKEIPAIKVEISRDNRDYHNMNNLDFITDTHVFNESQIRLLTILENINYPPNVKNYEYEIKELDNVIFNLIGADGSNEPLEVASILNTIYGLSLLVNFHEQDA